MTNTLPEENFVEAAPRRGQLARARAAPIRPIVGVAPARRAGCRCRSPRTSPACALPGRDPQPGLGRRGRSRWPPRARRGPATSPVEASTPLGTSAATHGPLARVDRRRSPRAAASRGAPVEPGAEQRVDEPARPRARRGANGSAASPGSRRERSRRVAAASSPAARRRARRPRGRARAAGARPRGRRRRCCPCRRRSRSARAGRAGRPRAASPAPARSISSSAGMPAPRSPTGRWRASAPRRAAAPASAGRAHARHRHRARHALRVGERDRDRRRRARGARPAAAPCSRSATAAPPADDLDVARVAGRELQRLGDRLLGAEARRQVLPGPRARRRVRALAVGEQPLGEPRAPRERALQAVDLEEVEAHAAHATIAVFAGLRGGSAFAHTPAASLLTPTRRRRSPPRSAVRRLASTCRRARAVPPGARPRPR